MDSEAEFGAEMQSLMSVPPEAGNSFTALLELPPCAAVKLLHSPAEVETAAAATATAQFAGESGVSRPVLFPADAALLDRASKYSVFAVPDTAVAPVKLEPVCSDSVPDSVLDSGGPGIAKLAKRKEREKFKSASAAKRSKNVEKENAEKLPYVHVRARRGQATDSHSLAERARREKINARMKLLQELVPGCNKISGTAMVLDEIINHVQSLQRQVEFLSMRLAAVNPRIDINLDNLFSSENASFMDCELPGMITPSSLWLDGQMNGNRQQYQQLWQCDGFQPPLWIRDEGNPTFITPENSLLSYDSSGNSDSLHKHQLKVEL